eukprot:m.332560 g.332560  ORF g.332560 m.332560 type:complete len:56 (+) comp27729_c0_seq5:187-354(+)
MAGVVGPEETLRKGGLQSDWSWALMKHDIRAQDVTCLPTIIAPFMHCMSQQCEID